MTHQLEINPDHDSEALGRTLQEAGRLQVSDFFTQETADYLYKIHTENKDWGGHLAFFDDDGNITEALIPSFNTFNIFLVPQMHSVQLVSPFAGGKRTS